LAQTVIGNPLNKDVRMGSLAGKEQVKEVKAQVQKLLASSQIIYGSLDSVEVIDADNISGSFISPILMLNENPFAATDVHEVEAFGPVSTIMPYKNIDYAIELSKMGKGSLCSSIITASTKNAKKHLAADFSNYGKVLVDVFAPGKDIYSTIPQSAYKKYDGTSMAAPMVAGVAALLKSYFPSLTMLQIKNNIRKLFDDNVHHN
jgi:acyl-CoA reductase-like NAD-dependent aldehyde dehydrogenase